MTQDDILLNYPPNDRLLLVARLGLAGTLFFSIPVILLPARQVGESGHTAVTGHSPRSQHACMGLLAGMFFFSIPVILLLPARQVSRVTAVTAHAPRV